LKISKQNLSISKQLSAAGVNVRFCQVFGGLYNYAKREGQKSVLSVLSRFIRPGWAKRNRARVDAPPARFDLIQRPRNEQLQQRPRKNMEPARLRGQAVDQLIIEFVCT
jgi:DNA gyrase inhibitor GyrI